MFSAKWIPLTIALLSAGIMAVTPCPTQAGDAALLEILGFSEDGNFFAFEQYGNQDGSGAAYSSIDFYDVRAGRYADETKRVLVGGREGDDVNLEPTRSRARDEAKETLDRLGIRIGNVGRTLITRPLTDLDADSTSARFSIWTPLVGMISQDYSLLLELHPTKSERCYFDEQAQMFDLHLIDNITGGRTTLHHDEYLPEDRGCALAYRIAEVVAFEPVPKRDVRGIPVLVFLNVFSTGFEGHDMRYTVVGGTLQ